MYQICHPNVKLIAGDDCLSCYKTLWMIFFLQITFNLHTLNTNLAIKEVVDDDSLFNNGPD